MNIVRSHSVRILRVHVYTCTANQYWSHQYLHIFHSPDKNTFFQSEHANIFLISLRKHVVGTHQKRLTEAFLMRSHNICFLWRNKKIIIRILPFIRSYIDNLFIWSPECTDFIYFAHCTYNNNRMLYVVMKTPVSGKTNIFTSHLQQLEHPTILAKS